MPQIWMTYDELAALTGCSAADVRDIARQRALDRKRSRDGETRIKLDLLWTALFIERIRGADIALEQAIEDLRAIHAEMARAPGGREHRAEVG